MRSPFATCLTVGLAVALAAGSGAEKGLPGLDVSGLRSMEAPFAWAKPLHGGPIRALFIAPRFALRDVGELAARLDLDFDVAPLWDGHHLGYDAAIVPHDVPGASREEVLERLDRLLEKTHDLYVIGNVDGGVLPREALRAIESHVSQGAGLLVVRYADALGIDLEGLLPGRTPADRAAVTWGVAESPEWGDGFEFVRPWHLGEGRAVVLAYPGPRPDTHCLLPRLRQPLLARPEDADAQYALVARAALWAAGRASPLRVEAVDSMGPAGPADDEVPPDLPEEFVQAMRDAIVRPPFLPYEFRLNQPADRDYRVRIQVRDAARGLRVEFEGDGLLAKGSQTYAFRLPVGPGRFQVDLWLCTRKGVVAWHTQAITVEGWPEFSDLRFSKDVLLANDALDVTLEVRPDLHRPRESTVYVRATDAIGRRVSEAYAPVDVDGGPVRVTLRLADLLSGLLRVDVFLSDQTAPPFSHWDLQRAAHAGARFPVRRRFQGDGFVLIADAPPADEFNGWAAFGVLADLGVDLVHGPATPAFRLASGMGRVFPFPELTRHVCLAARDGRERTPCLTSPRHLNEQAARLHDGTALFWSGGSGYYSLGGGNRLIATEEDVCFSPSCLASFREGLESRHGSLAALNEAWGTAFPAWGAVMPSRQEAVANGGFAPWIALRRHMDAVFADAHRRERAVIRAIDPKARTGFRALGEAGPQSGLDWAALASATDLLGIDLDPLVVEKARSFQGRDSRVAVAVNASHLGADPRATARWLPWYLALHQTPGLWWTDTVGTVEKATVDCALTPAGDATAVFAALAEAVAAVRSTGLDEVLAQAERVHCGIALYASRASFYLNLVETGLPCDTIRSETAFMRIIEDLGYQFDFLSPDQVRGGALTRYALLVLPSVRALDDAEAAAIGQFHRQGGRLLADVAPGHFDEDGVPREAPVLDALFGIRHEGGGRAGASGTALLLNHVLPAYERRDASSDSQSLRRLLGAFLADTVGEGLGAGTRDDRVLPAECFAFRYGPARIRAVLFDPDARKGGRVTLSCRGHGPVYDLLEGGLVRGAKTVRVSPRPGRVALYAELPYEVRELALDAPARVLAGRRIPVRVTVKTDGPVPGDHLVRVGLGPAHGAPCAHYTQNLLCRAGEGETFIPLAKNEAGGAYVVTARDALTGCSASTAVRVTSRP